MEFRISGLLKLLLSFSSFCSCSYFYFGLTLYLGYLANNGRAYDILTLIYR